MNKIACLVEYVGADFSGFQKQTLPRLRTVQSELEGAISLIANARIKIICSGRTDTGVNATGQVIHFETDAKRDMHAWLMGINANLPDDVSVREVVSVKNSFHARFSAIARRYNYVFYTRKTPSCLLKGRATYIPLIQSMTVDINKMRLASQYLLGENDFNSFRSSKCQAKNSIRCVDFIDIFTCEDVVVLDIKANAFLHHMVRNIVGTLLEVGKGKEPVEWVRDVLSSKNRKLAGPTAPADGLYFIESFYPYNIFEEPSIAPFPNRNAQ